MGAAGREIWAILAASCSPARGSGGTTRGGTCIAMEEACPLLDAPNFNSISHESRDSSRHRRFDADRFRSTGSRADGRVDHADRAHSGAPEARRAARSQEAAHAEKQSGALT